MFSQQTRDRISKFKSIKKAYFSACILLFLFVLSLGSEFLANEKPIYIYYEGTHSFPILFFYKGTDFTQSHQSYTDYVALAKDKEFRKKAIWIPALYAKGPYRSYLERAEPPPHLPSSSHLLGTDRQGRDVLARLLYGFRVCMLFSLSITLISMLLSVCIGGLQGFFGGWTDIIGQRSIEIWSALPFLYVVILVGSIYGRNFLLLVCLQSAFAWIGLSYYMRAEFLQIKNMPYIRAAKALGLSNFHIFFSQILPNALVPLLTLLPFSLIGGIGALTALDFLGFGLQPPTPSWGELLQQGLEVIREFPHIALFTTIFLFVTLLLATFTGEGLRDAFDPKHSVFNKNV